MRKMFKNSWPQCNIMLALAGVIVMTPGAKPAQFVIAGILAATAVTGFVVQLTERHSRSDGPGDKPVK